ncbi:MAG: lipopolysaccharide/colanic/teichoic acid biosynthesis glycosyltransferase [Luteibaculaceae bacterium]|jgi:lipopolysaccharide/colanic/teichoic acid biosynthesis glycosyltransferase
MKRLLDILASLVGLFLLSPVFIGVILWILWDDPKGGPFFVHQRIGKGGKTFGLFKFRSMYINSGGGQITVGDRDPRITRSGYFIRKFKLDELPQLINVFIGEMSLVGPRPEVKKYVDLYTEEQKVVLNLKPGITDLASLHYFKEAELLAQSSDPETTYIEEIMPAKLKLNIQYVQERKGVWDDIRVILLTFAKMWKA